MWSKHFPSSTLEYERWSSEIILVMSQTSKCLRKVTSEDNMSFTDAILKQPITKYTHEVFLRLVWYEISVLEILTFMEVIRGLLAVFRFWLHVHILIIPFQMFFHISESGYFISYLSCLLVSKAQFHLLMYIVKLINWQRNRKWYADIKMEIYIGISI